MKDRHIKKSHNKNALLYHIVCPVRYRRRAITDKVSVTIKKVCEEISERYEIHFVEIGADNDHVHFLVQSVPMLAPKEIVQIIKSIIAIHVFRIHPEVKEYLWGGKFWTSGYYINTVGLYAGAEVIEMYVRGQGKEYQDYKKYHQQQPTLFDGIN